MKWLQLFEAWSGIGASGSEGYYQVIDSLELEEVHDNFETVGLSKLECSEIFESVFEAWKYMWMKYPKLKPQIKIDGTSNRTRVKVIIYGSVRLFGGGFHDVDLQQGYIYTFDIEFDIVKLYDEWFLLRPVYGFDNYKCDEMRGLKKCIQDFFHPDTIRSYCSIPSSVEF